MIQGRGLKMGEDIRPLFSMLMRNKGPSQMQRDVQVIELFYPITRGEISTPVRNTSCRSQKICIWPLQQFLNEAQGQLEQLNTRIDISAEMYFNGSFACGMCEAQNNHAKVSYHSFYYDRKLDYLIKKAKEKYIESHGGSQVMERGKNRTYVFKEFKSSKLFIYRGGGVVFEFKKKMQGGFKFSYRVSLLQNTLNHYCPKLVFNPKDYLKNLSGLKLTQCLAQHYIGEKMRLGLIQTSGCYSEGHKKYICNKMQKLISQSVEGKVTLGIQEDVYCARISISRPNAQKKVVQLIVYYPRSNITQIFSLDDKEQLVKSCQFSKVKLVKLSKKVMLYTSTHTFLIKLTDMKEGKKYYQKQISFTRPILYLTKSKDESGKLTTKVLDIVKEQTTISYLHQHEIYYACPNYIRWESIKDLQDVCMISSGRQEQTFVLGRDKNGKENTVIYRLRTQDSKYRWQCQSEIQMDISSCKCLIQESQETFYLFMKIQSMLQHYDIYQLSIVDRQLKLEKLSTTSKSIKSDAILPFKLAPQHYILFDLRNKEQPLTIDINTGIITQTNLSKQIMQYFKGIFDKTNQQINAKSYPSNTSEHNEINYTIICDSIVNLTYKIVYGCNNKYMISKLGQTLFQ